MNRLQVTVIILILSVPIAARAGLDTETGEFDSWNARGITLIVARVVRIKKLDSDRHSTHIAVLEPLAKLAGHFDPTRKASLEVGVWVDPATSSVKKMPPEGCMVLAVVYFDSSHNLMRVHTSVCPFMPEGSAMVRIEGFGDKRVLETIAAVRAARGIAAVPATQP